jgi:hypothetical protein
MLLHGIKGTKITNNVFSTSSLSNANPLPDQTNANWPGGSVLDSSANGLAIESWSSRNFLFHEAAKLLFYTVQRITATKTIFF